MSDNSNNELDLDNLKKENTENKSENNIQEKVEEKTIFDINIDSLEYLIKYLISKEYDFFTLEPSEDKVKIGFRKGNSEIEVKYIKFPIYSQILLKAKIFTKLKIEETKNSQEGNAEMNFNKKTYKVISKTAPSNTGERLFLKISETEKVIEKKKKEKMSMGKILTIFAGLLFTSIVLGGVFITIVLYNSTSVQDLQFLNNLGINTNLIKEFTAKLVNSIFGFILLVEIILLFVFSYKAILTKKEFKQKRISRIMISVFFLLLSTITLITWMFLYGKILALKGINYGKIEYFDNSKYLSPLFDEESSKINVKENIIGPVAIRFDIKEFIQKHIDEGFTPSKLIWKVGGEIIEKPSQSYDFIYNFEKKGLNNVQLSIEGINIQGKKETKLFEVGDININNLIKIEEIKLDNGGSKFVFDASDLEYLGKIKWYYIPSLEGKDDIEKNLIITKALSEELLTGYNFNSKNIFEGDEYYGIKIVGDNNENDYLDKIFIISKGNKNEISGNIEYNQDLNNQNKYDFIFKNPETKLGEAFIKEYIWKIQDFDDQGNEKNIIINKTANLSDLENSSKINYKFLKAGTHNINLTIVDSKGKEQHFNEIINISKQLELLTKLEFKINNTILQDKKDIIYEKENNTYYIENVGSPTILEVEARKIRAVNQKYGLDQVYWDLDNDGNYEINEKLITYNINTEGNHTFNVKYSFVNKNIETDIIDIIETIHVSSIEKDAILDLKIIKDTSYVPVVVSFDASNSKVTGKNIDKFIFNYGDGTAPEERDGKNTGHNYNIAGDYIVGLTVITTTGEKYSIEKQLILKPKPQTAKITASLKKASTYQDINFSAEGSIGEVGTYLWDFGDGTTSSLMNLSHLYSKPGTYKVILTLEYTNKNIKKDETEILIYEE